MARARYEILRRFNQYSEKCDRSEINIELESLDSGPFCKCEYRELEGTFVYRYRVESIPAAPLGTAAGTLSFKIQFLQLPFYKSYDHNDLRKSIDHNITNLAGLEQ